jgi:hypothetical protein
MTCPTPLPSLLLRLVLAFGLLAAVEPALAESSRALPTRFEVEYKLIMSGFTVGRATAEFTRDDQELRYRYHARPTRLITWLFDAERREHSYMRFEGGRLRAQSYLVHQTGDDPVDRFSRFDWGEQRVITYDADRRRSARLTARTYDPLSAQIAMMVTLHPDFQRIRFDLLDKGDLDDYHLDRVGTERLKTAIGRLDTLRVRQERVGGSKRVTDYWLADRYHYLPVQVEQKKSGKTHFRLKIDRLEWEPEGAS